MAKAREISPGRIMIKCIGCDHIHVLGIDPSNGRPCWSFNGDFEKPTFQPSLLVRTGHHVTGESAADCLFCKDDKDCCTVCHSFITDGKIQYLNDCTHAYAGQTLELPEVSDE